MTRIVVISLLVLVVSSGCQDSVPDDERSTTPDASAAALKTKGTVGIVKFERLFELLGLRQEQAKKQREVDQTIKQLQAQVETEVKKRLAEYGGPEKLTDEQRKEFKVLEDQLRRDIRNARQELAETNQFLIRVLNQRVTKPMKKVAEKRGLDMVMIWRPNVFAYTRDTIDITDEVLEEIGIAGSQLGVPQSQLPSTLPRNQNVPTRQSTEGAIKAPGAPANPEPQSKPVPAGDDKDATEAATEAATEDATEDATRDATKAAAEAAAKDAENR